MIGHLLRADSLRRLITPLMKLTTRLIVLLALVLSPAMAITASNMADITKAQIIIGKAMEIATKFAKYTVDLEAPKPRKNNRGKFLLPYDKKGNLTAWATKALNAKLGAAVGEKAGDMASNAVASKVPFGGLAKGFMKKKAKETGVTAALGGRKFIKKSSSLSFNDIEKYAVYLFVKHGKDADYTQALAAAMALYPDLEFRYDAAIDRAYRKALTKR